MLKLLGLSLMFLSQLALAVTYGSNCDVSVGLCGNAVNSSKIEDGTVLNEDLSTSAAVGQDKLSSYVLRYVDVAIANAAIDTLNATPVDLVAAPGAGIAIVVDRVFCYNDFVTAALENGTGTFDARYENSSGGLVAQFTNAWVESAADAYFSAPGLAAIALVNKAIVLHASADITSGGGNLACRTYYRTVLISDI